MAFKTVEQYNDEKYGNLFTLANDKDSADVIILYRGINDVLVADTHYIKSPQYSGYVHCNGVGCPACQKGIKVQTKLFIPLYDINKDEIVFFDRSARFMSQLQKEVISMYSNPSAFVFRITRNGEAGDVNTTYSFQAVASVPENLSYDAIMAKFDTTFPAFFDNICKDVSPTELAEWLNNNTAGGVVTPASMPAYTVTPRGGVANSAPAAIPTAPAPDASLADSLDEIDGATEDSESLDDDPVAF